MEEIILASASPRRSELLTQIGIRFRVEKSHGDEIITKTAPGEIVEELALQKAAEVAQRFDAGIILGADTIVWAEGKVLGKPKDRQDAKEMLLLLQNRAHSVFTGVTLIRKRPGEKEIIRTFHRETRVHVHSMSEEEIESYLDTGDPFDKAGSYGIQGPFAAYVDGIEGDYLTVVGLPVSAVYQELRALESSR